MASKQPLTRDQSLSAKPVAVKILRREDLPDGGQRLIVATHPTGLRKFLLRLPDTVERSFELDAFGVEILNQCDGQKTIRYILKQFARAHQLDEHEAERAVLTFLRTLIQKGLVAVVVPK